MHTLSKMSSWLAVTVLVTVAIVGCGDNISPGQHVETAVDAEIVTAGDPVIAHCSIVDDYSGDDVLDKNGKPLADSTTFAISYEAPTSFQVSGDQTLAIRAGEAAVRCAAPDLGLVDATPEHITIMAGPAVRAITKLDRPTTLAGESDGVSCLAYDQYDNPIVLSPADTTISISPSGAGTTATTDTVSADLAGDYTVDCILMGATDVVPADLVVNPALPSSLTGTLDPERTVYAQHDQVTILAAAFDRFGNRVDDVNFAYDATPATTNPATARYKFDADGEYELTADVVSPTDMGVPLGVTLPAVVDTNGLAINCMRIDSPTIPSQAYMMQTAPGSLQVPVKISGAFTPKSVTIGGTAATLDGSTGNYRASVPIGFGMNFVDVVATDQNNVQNSTTCFVLAAQFYSSESLTMPGAVSLRLDQYAIGDPDPNGLNSLDDLFYTVLNSNALRTLVDSAISSQNPINSGDCGFFACEPNVNYNGGTIAWDRPQTSLTLINGGLRANIYMPNVRLSVNACGTFCCPGGSNIGVTASFVSAQVDFSLTLQGGRVRTALATNPSVTVGSVSLNSSGFCGFVIDLIQGFFTGTVANAVKGALQNFLQNNVAPILDGVTSSLDISTIATSFAVPRLDGTGTVNLGFGLAFSSLDINPTRALIGVGTKFTPGATTQVRGSLGIARRTEPPLMDPTGTSTSRPVGITAYEGVLGEVLHALWRNGFFQATLNLGGGTATIDSWLPPVAIIGANNTAELELGGVAATLTIPGIIDQPISIMFGGHANANVSLNGNDLTFGNLVIDKLYVSFQVTLSQSQRTAMASFLTSLLQDVLGTALNNGLPALPIPSFTLPAAVSTYGLPAGASIGIVNPVLSTGSGHAILDGQFGVR